MELVKQYDNGLRLVVSTGGCFSTSFGIYIGSGAVNESLETSGISHFIEHMSFKGTDEYTYKDIVEKLELLGTAYNAYTSVNNTFFYAKSIKENLNQSFKIVSSAVFRSVYPEVEFEKERNVIIEEINMSNDTPEDVCFDLASRSYFGDDGYGRTILGPIENIKKFTREDLVNYVKNNYVAENIIVTFVGDITLDEADGLVKEYILPYVSTKSKIEIPIHNTKCLSQHLLKNKDIEQTHICIDIEDVSLYSDKKVASDMANFMLGGGMSSRLFTKIREELSLAYNIQSSKTRYSDCGYIELYAGVSNKKAEKAIAEMEKVLIDFANTGCTDTELEKTRTTYKVDEVFSQEKPMTRLILHAKNLYYFNEPYDFKKKIAELESVSKDDINEVIRGYLKSNYSSCLVGKNVEDIKINWRK